MVLWIKHDYFIPTDDRFQDFDQLVGIRIKFTETEFWFNLRTSTAIRPSTTKSGGILPSGSKTRSVNPECRRNRSTAVSQSIMIRSTLNSAQQPVHPHVTSPDGLLCNHAWRDPNGGEFIWSGIFTGDNRAREHCNSIFMVARIGLPPLVFCVRL